MVTSAENILTGMPNALARPKSANFSSPFWKKVNKKDLMVKQSQQANKEKKYVIEGKKKKFPCRESNPGRLGESQES